jgi:septum formation protein
VTLWLADKPLVLASGSETRRRMLEAAGVPPIVQPAQVDERALQHQAPDASAVATAIILAKAKASEVAGRMPGYTVVGADQTLACEGVLFHKPMDRAAAFAQLMQLRGRMHELHSAVAVARGDDVLFQHCATARLWMRDFSEAFLNDYLNQVGASATYSVGGYQIESAGAQLFERIEGDHFTILGLPLFPLLAFLRDAGLMQS